METLLEEPTIGMRVIKVSPCSKDKKEQGLMEEFRKMRNSGLLSLCPYHNLLIHGLHEPINDLEDVSKLCLMMKKSFDKTGIHIEPTHYAHTGSFMDRSIRKGCNQHSHGRSDIFDVQGASEYILGITGPEKNPTIQVGCRVNFDLFGLPYTWHKAAKKLKLPEDTIELNKFYVSCSNKPDPIKYIPTYGRGVQVYFDMFPQRDDDEVLTKPQRYSKDIHKLITRVLLKGISRVRDGKEPLCADYRMLFEPKT